MVTLARYCYSSTAVPLAVPFFCCLCTQAEKPCSYIRTKVSLCPSCKAFPEVLVVQRAGLRDILEGVKGRSPLGPLRPIFLFFNPCFFAGATVFFFTIHFVFGVTFTLLCPAHLTLCPPTPNFGGVFLISSPSLLHHPLPHL